MFIDVGNTNTKILSNTGEITSIDTKVFNIKNFLPYFKNDNEIIVASVVPHVLGEIKEGLISMERDFYVIDKSSPYSFNFNVDGVGVDRLLSIEGALTLVKSPCAVIDAGTAITVDFVNFKNNEVYLEGGIIIPGFDLELKSLNDHTALLPSLKSHLPNSLIGTTTKDAMINGVCNTLIRGVNSLIDDVKAKLAVDEFKLFITGGAGAFFNELSQKKFTYVDDLIFKGMQNIARKR